MQQTEVYSGSGFFSAEIDLAEKACLPEVLGLFKGGFNPKPARSAIGMKDEEHDRAPAQPGCRSAPALSSRCNAGAFRIGLGSSFEVASEPAGIQIPAGLL